MSVGRRLKRCLCATDTPPMDLGDLGWAIGAVFWLWIAFFRGAERIDGSWLAVYLVEPLPTSLNPAHILKLVGTVYLLVSVVVLWSIVAS